MKWNIFRAATCLGMSQCPVGLEEWSDIRKWNRTWSLQTIISSCSRSFVANKSWRPCRLHCCPILASLSIRRHISPDWRRRRRRRRLPRSLLSKQPSFRFVRRCEHDLPATGGGRGGRIVVIGSQRYCTYLSFRDGAHGRRGKAPARGRSDRGGRGDRTRAARSLAQLIIRARSTPPPRNW